MQSNNSRNYHISLVIITLIGAALRFYHFNTLSLFNDELSALTRTHFKNFDDLITFGVFPDMHPAGIQILLYIITKLFGTSVWIIRLPFVVAGVACIPLVYFVAEKWFNKNTALLSASVFSALQYPVYFSQQARPYSIGLLMTLLMVYCMSNLITINKPKSQTLLFVGFILSGTCCMYIHYFSFLFAAIVGVTGIFLASKPIRKKLFLSGLAMILLALPHYKIYLHQLMVGGLGGPGGWLGPPDKNAIVQYIRYIFNDSKIVIILISFISIVSCFLYRKEIKFSKYRIVCVIFFLLPFLTSYYYSVYVNPVLQYSILIFSFPYLLMLLFSFIPETVSFRIILISGFIILTTVVYSTVIEKKYYTTEHYGVFKELAEKTILLNNKYGDDHITNTINVFNPYFINYYFDKYKRPVHFAQYQCMEPESIAVFRSIVETSNTRYFLHAWSNIYDPPEIEDIILSAYPFTILKEPHFNSAISFYSNKLSDSIYFHKPVFLINNDFENNIRPEEEAFKSTLHFHSGKYSSALNGREYGPTYTARLNDIGFHDSDFISVSAWMFSTEINTGAVMVVSIDDVNRKNIFWQSGKTDIYISTAGKWQHVFFTCKPVGINSLKYMLKIFPWNVKKSEIWIDDFEISIKKP